MAFLRATEEEDIQFQMAPMIDVVFLLLIFFLVATSFINPEAQFPTNLPQKQTEEEPTLQQFIVIVQKNAIMMNKRKLTLKELQLALYDQLARGEEVFVFVDATDDAKEGDVVRVLNVAKETGAKVTVVPPYEEVNSGE